MWSTPKNISRSNTVPWKEISVGMEMEMEMEIQALLEMEMEMEMEGHLGMGKETVEDIFPFASVITTYGNHSFGDGNDQFCCSFP